MITKAQKSLEQKLKEYKKRFLVREHGNLVETGTRMMVDKFLTKILGYAEIEEIKPEYRVSDFDGGRVDYVVEVDGKIYFIVEAKPLGSKLDKKPLKQLATYALEMTVDWGLLTDGSTFKLYKLSGKGPISERKVFEHNIREEENLLEIGKDIMLLAKTNAHTNKLERHWKKIEAQKRAEQKRSKAEEDISLKELLFNESVLGAVRRVMKQQTEHPFSKEEAREFLEKWILIPVEGISPKRAAERKIVSHTGSAQSKNHSIEDYRWLALGSPTRQLFDLLNKQIEAIDSEGVQKKFLQWGIRYIWKGKKFIFLAPRSYGIGIHLLLPHHQLRDPEQKTWAVWDGNGAKMKVIQESDIPYALQLIRQLLEGAGAKREAERKIASHTGPAQSKNYSIENHKFLARGSSTRRLFDLLSKKIKDIDPERVQESVRQAVIHYKRDGKGFVDLQDLASGLNVYLYIPHAQLRDPERKTWDVSQKGQVSDGETKMKVAQEADILYVMEELIPQLLKK